MTGGNNGHYNGSLYDGEPIEPEVLVIARRLDHDGDTWRRGLPDEQHAAQRALAALADTTLPASAPMTARAEPHERGAPSQPGGMRGPNPQRRQRRPQRAQRLLAVAAMLVVVILLAAVLKALGSREATQRPTATPTTTATPAPTATSTPSFPGAWSVAGTVTTASQPDFAPSNPRVAYEAAVQTPGRSGPATTTVTLRRTDDAGKTWHNLALPPGLVVDDKLLDVHLIVSPFDEQTAFLYSARSAASCSPQGDLGARALPSATRAAQGSGGVCLTQYRSGDGGASWTTLTLPVSGIIGQVAYDSNGTVYALVHQPLYGSGVEPPQRLIASTDAGITWHVADAALWAQGYAVVNVAVAPDDGSTDRNVSVWAITNPVALWQNPQAPPQPQLWRSDDGGATWHLTMNGALTYPFALGLLASVRALYLVPQPLGDERITQGVFEVSTNGGASWANVPISGLPSDLMTADPQPIATGDGRLIVPFVDGNDTVFYAWTPGAAAWTQVAPPLHLEHLDQIYAVSNGGTTTLWAIYDKSGVDGNSVAFFSLH